MKATIIAAALVSLLAAPVRAECIPIPNEYWPDPPLERMPYYYAGDYTPNFAHALNRSLRLQFWARGRYLRALIVDHDKDDEIVAGGHLACERRDDGNVICQDPADPETWIDFRRWCPNRICTQFSWGARCWTKR